MKKATRQHTKAHNSRLILKLLYKHEDISRAEISRLTGLTRTTVSDAVAGLMDKGIVAEVGVGPSLGGKPPILLGIQENSRDLIGVDLANSEFRGSIINLRGKIKHQMVLPIYDGNGDAALSLVYRLIDELLAKAENPVLGIGIGVPGLMDPHRRGVRKAVNLDWHDVMLGDLLEKRYSLPVHIANDCQAAALAECLFGEAQDVANMVVLKVGRGTGAGIILNNQLYFGDGFGAGEIGHVVVAENGERCLCGHYGCLETVTSMRSIIRRARGQFNDNGSSVLRQMAASPADINSEIVIKAFQNGDAGLKAVVQEAGRYLGIAVANLVCALNIRRIVVAGSVSRFGEALLEPIRAEVAERSLASLAGDTRIKLTTLEPDIVTLGAGALLLSHELGLP
ncbi:MAG: ROK family transcriptional regulator [Desulfobacteraceae bacterium]|nr:ROK family transcriptional regulator [Desulfobacteraceae bacterium]